MKIGDEVYVHGYVDEIRKDCIIIRNEYGYFGTLEDEIYIKADRNDEPHTDEFKTFDEQVLELALNDCRFKHNGCNNCTRECMWRE